MLVSSLPILAPPTTHLLSSTATHAGPSPSTSNGPRSSNPNSRNRTSRTAQQLYPYSPHSLSALALEENAIFARKDAIRRFGWEWIKPAGCSRTMAGREEEEEERRAAEEAMAQAMDDNWEDAQGVDGQGETTAQEGDLEGAEERDLDDEVPDADALPPAPDQSGMEDEENSALQADDTGFGDSGLHAAETPSYTNAAPRGVHFAQHPSVSTGGAITQISQPAFSANPANTTPSVLMSASALHPFPSEESEMMMTPLSPTNPQDPDAELDLDAAIPDAPTSDADDSGEWQHTDTDASLSDSPSPPSSPRPAQTQPQAQPLFAATPGRSSRSMRLVSPSVNVPAPQPPARTRDGQAWLRDNSHRAAAAASRESFSPSVPSSRFAPARSLRTRRRQQNNDNHHHHLRSSDATASTVGAEDESGGIGSSSPVTPGGVGPGSSNAANRSSSNIGGGGGGRRMFSGRANPFQRRFFSGQGQGENDERGGDGGGGDNVSSSSAAVASASNNGGGRIVSTGAVRRGIGGGREN
ncbi:MAG: hypothetical protein Q9227_005760 [Pyrenula ochraceoflavens]